MDGLIPFTIIFIFALIIIIVVSATKSRPPPFLLGFRKKINAELLCHMFTTPTQLNEVVFPPGSVPRDEL